MIVIGAQVVLDRFQSNGGSVGLFVDRNDQRSLGRCEKVLILEYEAIRLYCTERIRCVVDLQRESDFGGKVCGIGTTLSNH